MRLLLNTGEPLEMDAGLEYLKKQNTALLIAFAMGVTATDISRFDRQQQV